MPAMADSSPAAGGGGGEVRMATVPPPASASGPVESRAASATPSPIPRPAPAAASPASPAQSPSAGSSILDQRRARRKGSWVKTLLTIFFVVAAVFVIICTGVGLSVYSWFEQARLEEQQKRDEAIEYTLKALALHGRVQDISRDAEIVYTPGRCTVRGAGALPGGGMTFCEVSFLITEFHKKTRWELDYVELDGLRKYQR